MTPVQRMPLEPSTVRKLEASAPGAVRYDVQLAQISRWRIGGIAKAVVEPRDSSEAARVMAAVSALSVPVVVVGETSNILFDSAGFDGIVIRVGSAMSRMTIDGTRIWAQAGVSVPTLAHAAAQRGLSGIEHTVGIPGTLGGLVLMNGGSQRRGIGENVVQVVCTDEDGGISHRDQVDCGFSYRKSSLQSANVIVLEVVLELSHGDAELISNSMKAILAERASKFPSDYPNCGSTFLSNPEMYSTVGPPGRAIENAGFKGYRLGDAQVSTKHANFLLNLGNATSDDVLRLIALIRRTVFAQTGYLMDCEVRHISPDGVVRPAHETASERWGDDVTADVFIQ